MSYIVVNIGCIECGVSSNIVGVFASEAEANEIAEGLRETHSWREGGQNAFEVFPMPAIGLVHPDYAAPNTPADGEGVMTDAPKLDEARLRELAEAAYHDYGVADIAIGGGMRATVSVPAFIQAASPSTILALLDALSAERERADDAFTLLFDFAEMARVGYSGKPGMRSSRVNVPASLFHRVNQYIATQSTSRTGEG